MSYDVVVARTVGVALSVALSFPAQAWDLEGHRVIAALAERQLSTKAKAALAPILKGAKLSDREICFWADDNKGKRPETKPWHWVNVPLEAEALELARDCPTEACITKQIDAQAVRLANSALPLAERREALAFVVHLVADIHQPLHVGDAKDRGGNRLEVMLPGNAESTDLHWLWDGPLVDHALLGFKDPAAGLALRYKAQDVPGTDGDPVSWANESHRLVQKIYRALPAGGPPLQLGPEYLADNASLVRAQLFTAGVRLASLLESALARSAR